MFWIDSLRPENSRAWAKAIAKDAMLRITIRTSTRLPAAQIAEVASKLSLIFQQTRSSEGGYEIVYDPRAPTFEAYGEVGRAMIPTSTTICELYASSLGPLATGITADDVAYAAYLSCLSASAEQWPHANRPVSIATG